MLADDIRKQFPILKQKVNGHDLVYLDNAATSQKPQRVIDKLLEYYSRTNANIHRGIHELSEKATNQYEQSKEKIAKFINAKSTKNIIYTRNTTESINLVAYALKKSGLSSEDTIITSELEHHSNLVPWQQIAKETGANLKLIPVKPDHTLDYDKFHKFLSEKVKLVAITQMSNVTGAIPDIQRIITKAHENDALVLVDAAQSAPHIPIDVSVLNCDFLAFSAHKMCGPTGIGVLYGKKELLNNLPPFLFGGDMIRTVSYKKSTWNKLPWKFEAGTPNIADAIAFGEAIDFLSEIGMENIQKYIRMITKYAIKALKTVEGLKIFGIEESNHRGSAIAFTLDNAHPHDIAQLLNDSGIAVRSGNHCVQPLHKKFKLTSTARASLYIYNTKSEIDYLVDNLSEIVEFFK